MTAPSLRSRAAPPALLQARSRGPGTRSRDRRSWLNECVDASTSHKYDPSRRYFSARQRGQPGTLIAMCLWALPASAHSLTGTQATNCQTRLFAISPALAGITVRVIDLGNRIELRNLHDARSHRARLSERGVSPCRTPRRLSKQSVACNVPEPNHAATRSGTQEL